jgi:hypothetical protein
MYNANLTLVYKLTDSCSDAKAAEVKDALVSVVIDFRGQWPDLCYNATCPNVDVTTFCSTSSAVTAFVVYTDVP